MRRPSSLKPASKVRQQLVTRSPTAVTMTALHTYAKSSVGSCFLPDPQGNLDPTLCPQPSTRSTPNSVSFTITPSTHGNFALCLHYSQDHSLWAFMGTMEVSGDTVAAPTDVPSTETIIPAKPLSFILLTEDIISAGSWSTIRFQASTTSVRFGRFFLGQSQTAEPCSSILEQVKAPVTYEGSHYTLIVHPRVAADHELCVEVPNMVERLR